MKRYLLTFLVAAACFVPLGAQPMDSLFASAPREVMPLLGRSDRLDLSDLYNAGQRAEVENLYGGTSRLEKKTERHLLLQPTPVSTWELVRLTAPADTVLLLLRTLRTPAATTDVAFYRTDWLPAGQTFPLPAAPDFYQPADTATADERRALLDKLQPAHVCARWDDGQARLVLSLSTDGLTADDRRDVALFLRELTYEWRDGAFRRRP